MTKAQDPYKAREAAKYERPIASREHLLSLLTSKKRPVGVSTVAKWLELTEKTDLAALRRRLDAMTRDGQLVRNRRGGYGLPEKMSLTRGRVIGHKDGFGFVVGDTGKDSLFLSPREMRRVMDGDRVLVAKIGQDRRGRDEGQVVEILERAVTEVVGRYYQESGIGFVTPLHQRLSQDILVNHTPEPLGSGALVTVELVQYPTYRTQAVGKVLEVLSDKHALSLQIQIAQKNYGIPHTWPDAVIQELNPFPDHVVATDLDGRDDLRTLPFVTIDGEDAQDFDDAVFCEALPTGGWQLWVAIADVSHYVKPNTALDREAQHRSTSVYFPQQVQPMLPEKLSNGLCSLNPKVDRLVHVCRMQINPEGTITHFKFLDGVICSKARLTYTEVARWLSEEVPADFQAIIPPLKDVYEVLLKARKKRGAIDFDTVETYFTFNEEGLVREITPIKRNIAHRMIEECMLAANHSAAHYLQKNKLPGLYRVHDAPQAEKLEDLHSFLRLRGLTLKGKLKPEPKDYGTLIDKIKGRPDEALVTQVLLRSLCLSVYSPDNIGHFGLAYDAYVQFTSPIRRYPDLIIHRIIRASRQGRIQLDKILTPLGDKPLSLANVADHASSNERRADEATRDVDNALKCLYMQHHVGDTFSGVISGVANFGLFVALDNFYVEGLIHVTSLTSDYYQYEPTKQELRGERTGKLYHLGDPITVKLCHVNVDERKIDLELASAKKTKR